MIQVEILLFYSNDGIREFLQIVFSHIPWYLHSSPGSSSRSLKRLLYYINVWVLIELNWIHFHLEKSKDKKSLLVRNLYKVQLLLYITRGQCGKSIGDISEERGRIRQINGILGFVRVDRNGFVFEKRQRRRRHGARRIRRYVMRRIVRHVLQWNIVWACRGGRGRVRSVQKIGRSRRMIQKVHVRIVYINHWDFFFWCFVLSFNFVPKQLKWK